MAEFKVGDRVMLKRERDWKSELPPDAWKVFSHCRFHSCPVEGFTDDGLVIVDVSAADEELGGKFNDIRVEPQHLNLVISLPPAGGAPMQPSDALFPPAADFRLVLSDRGPQRGKHLEMWDGAGNYLAGFPWWDHADKDLPDRGSDRFPLGTAEMPFVDAEQGWDIYIWEGKGFVYVAEGRGDYSRQNEFDIHFSVPTERYLSEWDKVREQASAAMEAFVSLEEALRHAGTARSLDLGNRGLTNLPDEIGRLVNLEHLNLYLNKLSSLPESFGELRNLRSLDLRFNQLTRLPESFARLELLQDVNLAENRLTSIPDYVRGMTELTSFFVSGNPIPKTERQALKAARPDMEVDLGEYERQDMPPEK